MPSFILAPRAKADLKEIGRYTKKTWGVEQRNKYLFGLEKRFHWLADNGQIGTLRPQCDAKDRTITNALYNRTRR